MLLVSLITKMGVWDIFEWKCTRVVRDEKRLRGPLSDLSSVLSTV